MPLMTATVPTDDAQRLLRRLCKHFGHKVEAQWGDDQGQVIFAIGECRLTATPTALMLRCQAPDADRLDELGAVVASHLVRFAGGAIDAVAWQAVPATPASP